MGAALLACAVSGAYSWPTPQKWVALVGSGDTFDTAEVQAQMAFGVAGTLSCVGVNEQWAWEYPEGPNKIQLRINGASAPISIPVETYDEWDPGRYGLPKWLADNNSVAISQGDKVNWLIDMPTGHFAMNYGSIAAIFRATANHATVYGSWGGFTLWQEGYTAYFGLFGSLWYDSLQSAMQFKVRAAGTVTRLGVRAHVNPRTSNTPFTLMKGAVAGNNVVTIAGGASGYFEDTTHSDSIADGDLICVRAVVGTGTGTMNVDGVNATFTNTVNGRSELGAVQGDYINPWFPDNDPGYLPLVGYYYVDTPEDWAGAAVGGALNEVRHGFYGTCRNLRINIAMTNNGTGTWTINLRIANANANQVLSIPGSTTGWFEDVTHTDNFGPGDGMCLRYSGGTTSSIGVSSYMITEEETADPHTGKRSFEIPTHMIG